MKRNEAERSKIQANSFKLLKVFIMCKSWELTHSLAKLPQSLREENKALRLQLQPRPVRRPLNGPVRQTSPLSLPAQKNILIPSTRHKENAKHF